MIGRRSALGDDFQAGAAGAREARRVRVVIDLHFLDGRGSNAGSVGLDAIDHERDPVGSRRIIVKKAGHSRDVILVEDRDAVKRVAIDEVGVLVFRTLSADEGGRNSGSDGDRFIWNRNLQSHAKGRLTPGCHGCVDAGIKETFGVKLEDVIAGRNVVEMERPGAVGARLGGSLITRGKQRYLSLGYSSAGGIE